MSPPDPEAGTRPSVRFLSMVSREFSRTHLVLSCGAADGVERVLAAESTPQHILHNIRVRLGCPIEVSFEDPETIAVRIDKSYESLAPDVSGAAADLRETGSLETVRDESDRDLLSMATKGETSRFVDAVLFEALSRGASDVHIQPTADSTLCRYRLDGVLVTIREIPRSASPAIVSRIKVLADLDITEQRLAQDGRTTVSIGKKSESGRSIDLRISTLPTPHGERVVIRLLDHERDEGLQSFARLGMPGPVQESYKLAAGRSNGIVLVTGPTGSGKSTTLYATLRWIARIRPGVNIMTIEDPIECDLSSPDVAVSQVQVSQKKGVGFASGLRHILRQDPDVIMIGEIRDTETARIAIQSSLTGHLVFSTMHTNDAVSAVSRLVDLGIEEYLVSASLSAVLAQRLVRTLHRPCAGKGCQVCLDSGYRGRVGIFELLSITEDVRALIAGRAEIDRLRNEAVRQGMRTLDQEGAALLEQGITDQLELERVLGLTGAVS
ncbi:MAG TPA: type II/IV secretion system protein [Phycisphaerales bacterium]|nr:type II/IV secretion system protein [Phycisphaerales bacterium]